MPVIHDMKINLPVIFIEENNQVTAHTPALDLATCGKDIDQAKKRFEEILVLFFEELCKMGTLEDVLLECGWKKVSKTPSGWEPPRIVGTITEQFKVPCHA
jgi:hypothetical protein